MQELIGYTTAIGETTRESGNIIGNSLKTIFSRITTMNPSIDALKSINVEVHDLQGNVRPVARILDDLGKKWHTLKCWALCWRQHIETSLIQWKSKLS